VCRRERRDVDCPATTNATTSATTAIFRPMGASEARSIAVPRRPDRNRMPQKPLLAVDRTCGSDALVIPARRLCAVHRAQFTRVIALRASRFADARGVLEHGIATFRPTLGQKKKKNATIAFDVGRSVDRRARRGPRPTSVCRSFRVMMLISEGASVDRREETRVLDGSGAWSALYQRNPSRAMTTDTCAVRDSRHVRSAPPKSISRVSPEGSDGPPIRPESAPCQRVGDVNVHAASNRPSSMAGMPSSTPPPTRERPVAWLLLDSSP